MRITPRPPTTIPGLGDTSPATDVAEAAAKVGGRAVTDRVQLSEAARLRQRLKSEIGDPTQSPSSDQLQALRAQVVNQTYAPSPRAIAERLLSELAADLLA